MERRRGGGVDVAPPLVVGDPRDAVRLPRGDQLERERRAHELRHRRRVRRSCRRRGRARRGGHAEDRSHEDEERDQLANHGILLTCRPYCSASAQVGGECGDVRISRGGAEAQRKSTRRVCCAARRAAGGEASPHLQAGRRAGRSRPPQDAPVAGLVDAFSAYLCVSCASA